MTGSIGGVTHSVTENSLAVQPATGFWFDHLNHQSDDDLSIQPIELSVQPLMWPKTIFDIVCITLE